MIIGITLIFIGLLVKYGKLYMLVAGYNAAPEEEKANYNIKKTVNLFMLVMLYMGIIMISGDFLAEQNENERIKDISFWAALVTGLPFLIWKSNLKENKVDEGEIKTDSQS